MKFDTAPAGMEDGISGHWKDAEPVPLVVTPPMVSVWLPVLVMLKVLVSKAPTSRWPKSVPFAASAGSPLAITVPLVPSTLIPEPV